MLGCLGECILIPRNISHAAVIYLRNCTEWDDIDLWAFWQNVLVYNCERSSLKTFCGMPACMVAEGVLPSLQIWGERG